MPVATPEEILRRLRREEFPVTREKVWFNTATYGPLPVSNVRAQHALLDGMMHGASPPGLGHWWEGANEVRAKVGWFIGCDPDDVALLRSTGEGISLVSLGLDWRPGDEVVLYDQEFPSGVYPFLALERRGVRVRGRAAVFHRRGTNSTKATARHARRAMRAAHCAQCNGARRAGGRPPRSERLGTDPARRDQCDDNERDSDARAWSSTSASNG